MFNTIIEMFKAFCVENELTLMILGIAALFITIMVVTDYTPGTVANVKGDIDDLFD